MPYFTADQIHHVETLTDPDAAVYSVKLAGCSFDGQVVVSGTRAAIGFPESPEEWIAEQLNNRAVRYGFNVTQGWLASRQPLPAI